MIRHLVNMLLFWWPPSRLFGLRRYFLKIAGIGVAPGVCFCGRSWVYGRGTVNIGRGTWLSPGVIIHSNEGAAIAIGESCDIGPGVEFIPGGHAIGDSARRAGAGTARPVSVGNGCWIGARSTLLGGVSLGDGCVVAAGSVVTRSFAANTLIAGVPATAKRQLR